MTVSEDEHVVNKEVFIGDWCVVDRRWVSRDTRESRDEGPGEGDSSDPKFYIGMVLGFSYLSGKTFKDREYSKLSAPVTSDVAKGIGMLCSLFTCNANGVLTSVPEDEHKYNSIDSYIGSIKRPAYANNGTNKVLTIFSRLFEKLNLVEN